MIFKPITNFLIASTLIDKFFITKTITNCFLSADYFSNQIEQGNLYFVNTENNLFFLIRKTSFYQLYYYINCFNEHASFIINNPISIEIIYRGENSKPNEIFNYWELYGFKRYLVRDNLIAFFKDIPQFEFKNSKIIVRKAQFEEVELLENIYTLSFDRFTGDLLTKIEIQKKVSTGCVLCAYFENEFCGFLEYEVKNNIAWLNHIAVQDNYRGKGVSNHLISEYIQLNKINDNTRYQLWVIQDNIAAVNLYKKFGFKYNNKSTASMLKI
ncbi:MAG: GNAT family N-acetyltransferase [Paludibacter sp.]|nr:GNAT family N-acetyltransferase [Paludibacter sp.]